MEAGLFECQVSNPLASSGTAKAQVVIAVRRVVVVAACGTRVARIVVS